MGNSVGAAAIAHASMRSERVERLVMLSGFVSDPPHFRWLRWLLLGMFVWPWGIWLWGKYRKSLFETPPADMEANHGEVLANLREPGRLRTVRTMMCASTASVAARLEEVSAPALIAMGAQDPDFPDPSAEAARQAELLGEKNQVVMLDGAGHYPQIERPEQTALAITEFMNRG